MIEFKVASLGNSAENGDFWQGLSAASVALQQAAQSETAVYQVFSDQLIKLGLHGSINLLNESETMLQVTTMVFSRRLMQLVRRAEKVLKVNAQTFEYSAHASPADSAVLTKGDIVFLPDNSEKMQQVIPPHIYRYSKALLKPFLKMPAILAPVFAKSNVIGVLYLAGANLSIKDVPAIAAFATYLSIALENARLFQAVQRAELQNRRLFESANDGIFVFDQNSRELLSANPKMIALLGVEADKLDGLKPGKWAPPDIYQLYNEHFNKTLQKGSHVFEVPFVDQAGTQRHWQVSATAIELDGKTVLNGLVRDITERVQSDLLQKAVYHITAVAHTHISLDELFKSIHEALAPILNVQNFYIALYDETSDMVNVAYFVDRYDKSPGLYKAKKGLTEFVIQSNDSQLLTHSQLLSYLNQGTIDVQGTLPQVWLGVPLQLQGKAIGALVVQSYEYSSAYSEQDAQFLTFVSEQIAIVIERKQAEERQSDLSTELRQQTRAMYRAQKMESLGILAGGIAHDFNNLLVAMINQTSLAQTYVADDHPSYIHIGKAVQAAEKAASLTQQLLAYSGSGQFSIKPISLNDLIQENIDLLKVAMPKQIVWDLAIENDTPLIDADLAQLQQVVMNLLINAAEAVGEQVGTIQVQTAVRHITPKDDTFWRYTGNELPAGAYVSLRVQDSGRGMDSKTISKIFDPFFTTKFTGRGLGLAAVLGIVRSHHGGLQVSSKAGKGTAFDLLFPISENSTTSSDPEAIDEGSATGGVVLIIDDEAAVRETVSDVLELEGIDVLTAVNGKKGVATYKEHIDSVDLVLLDLSMPGLSGQETFAKLQTLDPNVRILLSSGYSETDATRGFDSPPLVDFIQKPYRLNTFLHLIRKHIKKK